MKLLVYRIEIDVISGDTNISFRGGNRDSGITSVNLIITLKKGVDIPYMVGQEIDYPLDRMTE